MNVDNLVKVTNHIIQNPETWNQEDWHCGSSHCLFGWAQIFAGKKEDRETVENDACGYFGIKVGGELAIYLCQPSRKLTDLRNAAYVASKMENPTEDKVYIARFDVEEI